MTTSTSPPRDAPFTHLPIQQPRSAEDVQQNLIQAKLKFTQVAAALHNGKGLASDSSPSTQAMPPSPKRRESQDGSQDDFANVPTAPRSMLRNITPPGFRRADGYKQQPRRAPGDFYRPPAHTSIHESSHIQRVRMADVYRPGDAVDPPRTRKRRSSYSDDPGFRSRSDVSPRRPEPGSPDNRSRRPQYRRRVSSIESSDRGERSESRRSSHPSKTHNRLHSQQQDIPSHQSLDSSTAHVAVPASDGGGDPDKVLETVEQVGLSCSESSMFEAKSLDAHQDNKVSDRLWAAPSATLPDTASSHRVLDALIPDAMGNPLQPSRSPTYSPCIAETLPSPFHISYDDFSVVENLPSTSRPDADTMGHDTSLGLEVTKDTNYERLTVRNISRLSRHSREDTSSTTSTATSRNRTICRGCAAPGSLLTPLIPCSLCSKGYHDGCGKPKPRDSTAYDEFVCGKCLKRRQAQRSFTSAAGHNTPTPFLSVENESPSGHSPAKHSWEPFKNAHIPNGMDRALQDANKAIGSVSHNVQEPFVYRNSSPKPNAHCHASDQALQGNLYKNITCPFWRRHKCFLFESHCMYAHRETGQDVGGKAFTCFAWRMGLCTRNAAQCVSSHKDTGLYLDANGNVLRKHITCYYWKVYNRCTKSEPECPYAHEDTGILVWQPRIESKSDQRKNSLREYMCPRWEKESPNHCKWATLWGQCPYSHHVTNKSCFPPSVDGAMVSSSSTTNKDTLHDPSYVTTTTPSISKLAQDESQTRDRTPRGVETDESIPETLAASKVDSADVGYDTAASSIASGSCTAPTALNPQESGPDDSASKPRVIWARRGGRGPWRGLGRGDGPSLRSRADSGSKIPDSSKPRGRDDSIGGSKEPENSTENDQISMSGVKRCELCTRQILGSKILCVGCSTGEGRRASLASSVGSGHLVEVPDAPMTMDVSSISELVPPAMEAIDTQAQTTLETSLKVLAQSRKRAAQDDAMFVNSRKRSKLAAQPIDEVAKALATSKPRQASSTEQSFTEKDHEYESLMRLAKAGGSIEREHRRWLDSIVQSSRNPGPVAGAYNSPPTTASDENDTGAESDAQDAVPHKSTDNDGVAAVHDFENSVRQPNVTTTVSAQSESSGPTHLANPNDAQDPATQATRLVQSDQSQRRPRSETSLNGSAAYGEKVVVVQGSPSAIQNTASYDAARASPKVVTASNQIVTKSVSQITSPTRSIHDPRQPLLPGRSCRMCSARHQRCFHKYLDSDAADLDPKKCWFFLQEKRSRAAGRFSTAIWQNMLRAASLYGSLPQEVQAGLDDGSLENVKNARGKNECSQTQESDEELTTDHADHTSPSEDESLAESDEHSLTDTETVQKQFTRGSQADTDSSAYEDDNDVPLAQLRLQAQKKAKESQNPIAGTYRLHVGMVSPSMTSKNNCRVGAFADKMAADDEHALRILREQGIKIDSELEESDPEQDRQPNTPPPLVTDPLHHLTKSQNLFDLDRTLDVRDPENYWRELGLVPPWQRKKPSKKELMKNNNLLKWQMWCNSHRYGNPHIEVMKNLKEVSCETAITRQVRSDTPDPFATPQMETVKMKMTFSEFIGLPEKPIIEYGRNEDELVIREGKDNDVNAGSGNLRRRRIKEDERFPFVYDILQAKRGG